MTRLPWQYHIREPVVKPAVVLVTHGAKEPRSGCLGGRTEVMHLLLGGRTEKWFISSGYRLRTSFVDVFLPRRGERKNLNERDPGG